MNRDHWRSTRPTARLREGRADWYSIKNLADSAPSVVSIYDEVGYFGVTAQDFIRDLSSIDGDIELHLSTPGGEVFDGIAIYGALKQRAGNVAVIVDSLAASIGSVIAMAASPGQLAMMPNASMMIHDGFALCVGNAADMMETAALLDKTSDNIASIYAERTGKSAAEWRTAMKAETWYIGQEAVDAGLADRVLTKPAAIANEPERQPAMAAHFDLSVFRNTPAALVHNHAGHTTPPEGPPPPTTEAPTEAPADTDRGFSVPVNNGERGSEPEQPPGVRVVEIEWSGKDAGGEFLAWLRQNIRVKGATSHAPFDGTHTHAHPAFGEQGDDDSHEHEHSHDGDADHQHAHGDGGKGSDSDDGMQNGAATGRRILGIESMPLENRALPVHHTAVVDEPWDGPAAVAAMPNDASVLEYCHAWEDSAADDGTADDPDGDADDKKSSWKFPHHLKKGGPANLAACRNGLARLEGSSIPDSDKSGVKAHLQAHLDDAAKNDDGASNHIHEDIDDALTWDPEVFRQAMERGLNS